MTSYPSSRNACAVAKPMPELAPSSQLDLRDLWIALAAASKERAARRAARPRSSGGRFFQRDDNSFAAAPQVMPGDACVDFLLIG